jgi:hypothetical protein
MRLMLPHTVAQTHTYTHVHACWTRLLLLLLLPPHAVAHTYAHICTYVYAHPHTCTVYIGLLHGHHKPAARTQPVPPCPSLQTGPARNLLVGGGGGKHT